MGYDYDNEFGGGDDYSPESYAYNDANALPHGYKNYRKLTRNQILAQDRAEKQRKEEYHKKYWKRDLKIKILEYIDYTTPIVIVCLITFVISALLMYYGGGWIYKMIEKL